ncbi:MAG TPA: S24 family peptidase [Paludibaculum sp.]|jgi:hypothetical protein
MHGSAQIRTPLTTRTAEYRVFEALGENCGIVLTDPETGECAFRFRRDWEDFAGDEAEVLRAIADDLPRKQREMGTAAFLLWLDETLSNTIRIVPPCPTICGELDRTANTLYRRMVHSTVRRYETHLPLIPIDLAAGGRGTEKATGATRATNAKEWIEAEIPGRRGLTEDFFIVRIHGHSMEPHIPDGSLCVFRSYCGGSRKNGIFIVQRIATMDDGGEYTIKRYDSSKKTDGDSWSHQQIRMKPGNPEFQEWNLREEDQNVTIAEFVCVLEDPA